MAYCVEAYWTEDVLEGPMDPVTARPAPSFAAPAAAQFAYLFPWNTKGAARIVAALWKEGFQLALAREPFTLGGRAFPGGTVVVRTRTNPDSLHARLVALAAANEVEVLAANSAFVEKGKDLGDASVVDLKKPSIAVICEPPTTPRRPAFSPSARGWRARRRCSIGSMRRRRCLLGAGGTTGGPSSS